MLVRTLGDRHARANAEPRRDTKGRQMTNRYPFPRRATTAEQKGKAGSVPVVPPRGGVSLRQNPVRARRLFASLGVSIALAYSVLVTASPASAAPPCGLSYSGPVFGQYTYTIRNCHSYGVRRKLDLRISESLSSAIRTGLAATFQQTRPSVIGSAPRTASTSLE